MLLTLPGVFRMGCGLANIPSVNIMDSNITIKECF